MRLTKIFHESVVVNLLETVLYHKTAIDAADEALLELVDFAYRYVSRLVAGKLKYVEAPTTAKELAESSKERDFDRQLAQIEFQISMSCISIIRYITDQIKTLKPAVLRHIHLENDTLMALVALIEERPWLRKKPGDDGIREKFEDGQWVEVKKGELSKLPKLEGQVWIAIYNLFLSPECAKTYEITDYRKNMLLRVELILTQLRKYLNEIIIDQIPNLADIAKTLDQMSVMNTNAQASSNPFVVQQVPEYRQSILENRNWKEIADYQLKTFFTREAEAAEFDMLTKFADMYSDKNIEALSEGLKCANCGQPATQRCSRCKVVWYCGRDCQVTHYKKEHKKVCKELAEKMADKLEKSGIKKGDIILDPKKVKEGTSQNPAGPKVSNSSEETSKMVIVEVLNSTEHDEDASASKGVKPKAKPGVHDPKSTQNIAKPSSETSKNPDLSSEVITTSSAKAKEEETNKMEELD